MTQAAKFPIECDCGKQYVINVYKSINAQVDPELSDKVLKNQINVIPCEKCGKEEGLIYPFLYVDDGKHLNLWVYPEFAKLNQINLEREVKNKNKELKRMFGDSQEIRLVFGYEELNKILKNEN